MSFNKKELLKHFLKWMEVNKDTLPNNSDDLVLNYLVSELDYVNNKGDKFKIIDYISSENVTIIFEDGSIRYNITLHNIKRGCVKNLNKKDIFNVAFVGDGTYLPKNYPLHYTKWKGMLNRVYSTKYLEKFPTYKDVTVCEEWHNFQNFAQWFEDNYKPEYMEGWHLDKDILIKGNKAYSPETCCFVPAEINGLFVKNDSKRGELPIAVRKTKSGLFSSRLKIANEREKHLGVFSTIEEAFIEYKKMKEEVIKTVADKWKDLIGTKVYDALYNYKVEMTD